MLLDHLRDGVLQRLDALARDGRDGIDRHLAALRVGRQLLQLVGVGNIGL